MLLSMCRLRLPLCQLKLQRRRLPLWHLQAGLPIRLSSISCQGGLPCHASSSSGPPYATLADQRGAMCRPSRTLLGSAPGVSRRALRAPIQLQVQLSCLGRLPGTCSVWRLGCGVQRQVSGCLCLLKTSRCYPSPGFLLCSHVLLPSRRHP